MAMKAWMPLVTQRLHLHCPKLAVVAVVAAVAVADAVALADDNTVVSKIFKVFSECFWKSVAEMVL